jgi:hypothetical protein
MIYDNKFEGFYHGISLSKYGPGLYIVKIREGNKVTLFKIICN